MDKTTQESLDLMKASLDPALAKAGYNQPGSATTGLQGYDLEAPAKLLYPVLSPIRNILPRAGSGSGTQANWKAVTAIDTTVVAPGVSEGNRNAVMTSTMTDYNAVYKGFGAEHYATFEAQYAGQGFIDLRARATTECLQKAMIDEEFVILGGNTSVALGTANTPTGTLAAGGSMTAQITLCFVVGLTLAGNRYSSVSAGVKTLISRTNADATVDSVKSGHGIVSAASTGVTTAGGNLSVTWTVVPKRGEVAWAWFVGTAIGTAQLAAITTVPQFAQTANPAGTQLANVADLAIDQSQDALSYDGIITQVVKSGNNGYYKILGTATSGGATLTADGAGGIVEIDDMLQDRWDNYRLTPDTLWVNSQQARDITKKTLAGGSAGVMRIEVPSGGAQASVMGGSLVTSYFNKFLSTPLAIKIHPYLPAGTIIATSSSLPYAVNGVPNVWQVKTRQDYYSIEWPLKSRKFEVGVYYDAVLQGYFPPANAVIQAVVAG